MIELPDAGASRAVLVGVHTYRALDNLPAVERNLTGLRDAFADRALWGLAEDHCVVLSQPDGARAVLDPLRDVAAQATDTLVIYYAGHCMTEPYSGELALALPDSDPERPGTGLRYEHLRRLVREPAAPARRKVVILDCCHSGRAPIGMSAATQVADRASVGGAYVMAACAETREAMAPPGEPYTAFTGELISALTGGIPNGPELLDTETVYRHLRTRLSARSRPVPQRRDRDAGGVTALARNVAPASSRPAPPMAGNSSRPAPPPEKYSLRGVYSGAATMVSRIAQTLGPAGTPVTFTGPDGRPAASADPEVVCEARAPSDPDPEPGVELIRTLVRRMRAQCGDGAATAAVIAKAMMGSALSAVEGGHNPTRLGVELLRLSELVVEDLNRRAMEVETKERLAQILATVTEDRASAEIIAEAADKIGKEGFIAVEERDVPGLELDVHPPMYLPGRLRSGAGDFPRHAVSDALFVVLAGPPTEALRRRADQEASQGRPVILLGPGPESGTIVAYTTVEDVPDVVIPDVDPLGALDDIAVVTGAEVSTSWNPIPVREILLGPAGLCAEPAYDSAAYERIVQRIEEFNAGLKTESTGREHLRIRRARLAGGFATVWMGPTPGEPETDFTARKKLLVRATHALQPLIEKGYLAGGGAALHTAGAILDSQPNGPAEQALRNGLSAPLIHLAESRGAPDQVLNVTRAANMIETGVLDPAAMVIGALTAATATTKQFLALA